MSWDSAENRDDEDEYYDDEDEDNDDPDNDWEDQEGHAMETYDPIFELPVLKEVPLKEFSLTPSFEERYKLKKALPIIFDVLNLDVSGEENGTKKVR